MLLDAHENYYLMPPLLDHKTLHLAQVNLTMQGAVMRFAEIDDRQKAHDACGRTLLLRATDLSDVELEMVAASATDFPEQGYQVFSDTGLALGTLSDYIETGANLVWIVSTPEGEELLLPVIADLQIHRDDEQQRITVHVLEGLLELNC